jgi:hypothetical protein
MDQETLYDEFGNYIGPALDDSEEEAEEAAEEPEARREALAETAPPAAGSRRAGEPCRLRHRAGTRVSAACLALHATQQRCTPHASLFAATLKPAGKRACAHALTPALRPQDDGWMAAAEARMQARPARALAHARTPARSADVRKRKRSGARRRNGRGRGARGALQRHCPRGGQEVLPFRGGGTSAL